MPIPKRREGEKRKDFVNRCMADDTMVKDYGNRDQRYAICNSEADKKHKGKKRK